MTNGAYDLSSHVYERNVSHFAQSTATSLGTPAASGGTGSGVIDNNRKEKSSSSVHLYQHGTYDATTGYDLASVAYYEVSNHCLTEVQKQSMTVVGSRGEVSKSNVSMTNEQSRTLREEGTYANGQYTLPVYQRDELEKEVSSTNWQSDWSESSTKFSQNSGVDNATRTMTVHAWGSYANGSFSFASYSTHLAERQDTIQCVHQQVEGNDLWDRTYQRWVNRDVDETGTGQTGLHTTHLWGSMTEDTLYFGGSPSYQTSAYDDPASSTISLASGQLAVSVAGHRSAVANGKVGLKSQGADPLTAGFKGLDKATQSDMAELAQGTKRDALALGGALWKAGQREGLLPPSANGRPDAVGIDLKKVFQSFREAATVPVIAPRMAPTMMTA